MSSHKKITTARLAIAGAVALSLTGCASQQRVDDLEKENQVLRSDLASVKADSSAKDKALVKAQNQKPTSVPVLLPPKAKEGECYARVWVEPTYKDVNKTVLVREASERVEVIPAEYEWGTETVLVKQASSRLETVPAVYGTEKETIKVKEAQRVWRTDLGRNAPPASDELLATAKNHGIDLDSATPGMCFHEHYRPAEYTTEQKQVLVKAADAKVSVSKAEYRWVEKRVLVKEASTRIEEVPATYKWVEEQVLDVPAHTVWKKGEGPIQRIDEATGEIMCLVEIPATYKTIKKKVVNTAAASRTIEIPAEYKTVKVRELITDAAESKQEIPAVYKSVDVTKKVADTKFLWHEVHNHEEPRRTRTGAKICLTETPAEYKTITRRVVKTPATSRKVEIPEETKTIKVRKLVKAAQEKRIAIPAENKTITEKQLDKEGYMEWRSILCKTNMTNTRITQIQQALKTAGYNPGPIDGVIGTETMSAVNAFQQAKGLPQDKYLNIQTLNALGVSAK